MRKVIVAIGVSSLVLTACGGNQTDDDPVSSRTNPSSSMAGTSAPTSPVAPGPDVPAVGAPQYVVWQGDQRPSVGGVEQEDRIQQVPPVGPAEGRPLEQVMRFELRPGDVQSSGGYMANRTEVFSRRAESDVVPAEDWPDPPGSVRWFGFSLFIPEDFITAQDSTWLTFTQWKGALGGSPPLALEVKQDSIRLGGARTNAGLVPNDGIIGLLTRGEWTRFEVGISMSTDPTVGWVEVWRNGELALPRTALATMDLIDGQPDPLYFKQGIYRDTRWTCVHVLYLGPVKIGTSRERVV